MLLSEVRDLLGIDIRKYGSSEINAIFDECYRQFPPYEGREFIRMLANRSYYARQWALFLNDYPLVLKPFFSPGRDTEGAQGVRDALGCSHWSFIMNFLGLPAGNLPTHIAKTDGGPCPIGVQIAGRRWREDLIVDAMQAIEKRIPPACMTLWARS